MRDRRQYLVKPLVIVALALIAALLSACSIDNWAEIETGEYVALQGSPSNHQVAARSIDGLAIDRDQHLMVLTMLDGSEIVAALEPRGRTDWPSGCPTNINSTRMEVLDIAEDRLVIGSTAFGNPVLVRDCPRDPVRIVLRADGVIGGGGGACPHPEPCIYFGPREVASPHSVSLPRSPKGYELYSWKTGEGWRFTLVTGTNRLKTYEEIVSTGNAATDSDWVKLSVQGVENLSAVVGRLPEGETVSWISPEWLERAGATKGKIELPEPKQVQEVKDLCHRLGIQLQVAD